MKNTLLKLLLFFLFSNCSAQKETGLKGKWYMINKSGFVEHTITDDSIFNSKLHSNFKKKSTHRFAKNFDKQIKLKDRVLFLKVDKKDSTLFAPIFW